MREVVVGEVVGVCMGLSMPPTNQSRPLLIGKPTSHGGTRRLFDLSMIVILNEVDLNCVVHIGLSPTKHDDNDS